VVRVDGARIRSHRTDVAPGRTARVAFRLNRRGVRALTHRRRLRFGVALSARAGTGAAVRVVRRLTVRLR
jgi:hypothetical protein